MQCHSCLWTLPSHGFSNESQGNRTCLWYCHDFIMTIIGSSMKLNCYFFLYYTFSFHRFSCNPYWSIQKELKQIVYDIRVDIKRIELMQLRDFQQDLVESIENKMCGSFPCSDVAMKRSGWSRKKIFIIKRTRASFLFDAFCSWITSWFCWRGMISADSQQLII